MSTAQFARHFTKHVACVLAKTWWWLCSTNAAADGRNSCIELLKNGMITFRVLSGLN